MDIFELAKAKKLFGGGGGKREGTAIPVGQAVERIYFNLNNTIEETNALLSQLTYVQTPFMENPLCALYANTADGDSGSYIIAVKEGDDNYSLIEIFSLSDMDHWEFFNKRYSSDGFNGWLGILKSEQVFGSHSVAGIGGMNVSFSGITLTDFSGIPVGAENEKIKNVLSITPF